MPLDNTQPVTDESVAVPTEPTNDVAPASPQAPEAQPIKPVEGITPPSTNTVSMPQTGEQISMPPLKKDVGVVPISDPDVLANISSTINVASNNSLSLQEAADAVQNIGMPAMRSRFTQKNQEMALNDLQNASEDAAQQGDADTIIKNIEQTNNIKNNPNPAALEKQAVNVLSAPNTSDILKERQWRTNYINNISAQYADQYAALSTMDKVKEFASNLFPLRFTMAVSSAGEGGHYNSLLDVVDPDGVLQKEYNHLMTLPHNEFVKQFTSFNDQLGKKSQGVFGDQGLVTHAQVLKQLIAGTTFDRGLDTVGAILDVTGVGGLAKSGGKAVISAARKSVGKDIQNTVINNGSLLDTTKQLGNSDQAAKEITDSVINNQATTIVPSPEAGAKNAVLIQEPMTVRSDANVSANNMTGFYNGIGKELSGDSDDRMVQEIASQLKQIQSNRNWTDQEINNAFKDNILDTSANPLDVKMTTEFGLDDATLDPIVSTRISKPGITGFKSADEATNYVKDMFQVDPKSITPVKDSSGTYHVLVKHGFDDLGNPPPLEISKPGFVQKIFNAILHNRSGIADGKIPLGLEAPTGNLTDETVKTGLASMDIQRALLTSKNMIYKRNIGALPIKDQSDLFKVATYFRDSDANEWPLANEIGDAYKNITGKNITVKQLDAWHDYKLLNDVDYVVHNLSTRNAMKENGFKSISINNDDPQFINFVGRELTSFEDIKDVPMIYDAENSVMKAVNKTEFDDMKAKGYQFVQSGDKITVPRESMPLEDQSEKQYAAYIAAKKMTIDDLPHHVLPYRANGRVQYAGKWFAKQPHIENYMINGEERKMIHPPITHAIEEEITPIKQFVKNFNTALEKLKKAKRAPTKFEDSMKNDISLRDAWAKTRWKTPEAFMADVKLGKATMHPMEALYDRQALKMGETLPKQSTGRLDLKNTDLHVIFDIARRGERKLDTKDMPARLKPPSMTLDESLTNDVKKLVYQNFINDTAKRFYKTFKDDLVEPYANPVQAAIHGEFNKSAETTRKALGRMYQRYIQEMGHIGFASDAKVMDALADNAARLEQALSKTTNPLSRAKIKALYGISANWKTAKSQAFLKNAMFHTTFGFFNVRQVLAQMTTSLINLGAETIKNPIQAGFIAKDSLLLALANIRGLTSDAKYLKNIAGKVSTGHSDVEALIKDYYDSGAKRLQRFVGQAEDFSHHEDFPSTTSERVGMAKAQALRAAGTFNKYGDSFFNIGTDLGNFVGFAAARRKLLKQYGSEALTGAKRARYLKDLRFETERLNFLQSGANTLQVQNASRQHDFGGFIVEMMTQYLQFAIKLTRAMLPTAIGGSNAYSGAEKAAYALSTLALAGPQALPFHNYMMSHMYVRLQQMGYQGSPEDFKNSWFSQGLVDGVLTRLTGTTTNFAQQISSVSPIEDVLKLIHGDLPLGQYVGGPMASKVFNILNTVYQTDNLQAAINGENNNPLSTFAIASLQAALSSINSYSNLKRLKDALSSPNLISKTGFSLAAANDRAAWMNFIGLNSGPYDMIDFQNNLIELTQKQIQDHINLYRPLFAERMKYAAKGDWAHVADLDAAIAVQMNFIPPQQIKQMLSGAIKNWVVPEVEHMHTTVQTALNNQSIINDRMENKNGI